MICIDQGLNPQIVLSLDFMSQIHLKHCYKLIH